MTENNKNRFTDNETDCLIDSSFTDNLTKKIYVIDEWERIIGLCNNLWAQTQRFEDYNKRLMEENEQLKSEIKELQVKYSKQLVDYNGLGCEYDWLKEENEQLKADNNRLVNETAKIVAEHQGRVLELIDKSLEKDKQYYEMSYEDYLNGRIEALEELKKELQK